jgi:hypothetical protein
MKLIVMACWLGAVWGCAVAPSPRPLLEDQTRRVAPIPACVMNLPARGPRSEGTIRRLRETEIAKLVIPAFDERTRELPANAVTCTGEDLGLTGGTPLHQGRVEQDGDVLYGAGGDRLKVVWLRTLSFPDGTVGGPLAIVRGREDVAEAFGVGIYRGRANQVTLSVERMGARLLVSVESDGCADRKPGAPCETVTTLFIPRVGRLERFVDTPALRIAFVDRGEPGVKGPAEYRLSSTATYRDDGVHIVEQLEIKNPSGDTVRKIERERALLLTDKGTMISNMPSLWDDTVKR